MKKVLGVVLLFMAAGWSASAQEVNLDAAIRTAADEIGNRLEKGTKIAVLNFSSQSSGLSDYMIEELNDALVNDGRLQVQARNQDILEVARRELQFNDSEEVSNKSAQQIGRMLGAETFVNGSMEKVGNIYRLRIQVLEVETLTMRYSKSLNIQNDQLVRNFMSDAALAGDFTTTERAGAAALNLAFGLGSFVMEKDIFGGGITAAIEGVGMVMFIYAAAHHASGANDNHYERSSERPPILETDDAYPFFIGLGVYAGGAIFGIVRAAIYHKPGAKISSADIPLNIGLVSDQRGSAALQLSYTMRY